MIHTLIEGSMIFVLANLHFIDDLSGIVEFLSRCDFDTFDSIIRALDLCCPQGSLYGLGE